MYDAQNYKQRSHQMNIQFLLFSKHYKKNNNNNND